VCYTVSFVYEKFTCVTQFLLCMRNLRVLHSFVCVREIYVCYTLPFVYKKFTFVTQFRLCMRNLRVLYSFVWYEKFTCVTEFCYLIY
jgi:hypothetical protein